ncbi:hypothetical protein BGZ63DRAFT_422125 [Mariannaea sp. PMI_226]|nr:hypothetical protein BGZ63DRAFT_422125 [Mariannaea sp. PMI_226]
MWPLVAGKHLTQQIVEAYLDLLRQESPIMGLLGVRLSDSGSIQIGDEGVDQPAIIPFKNGTHWAFAAVYADCIHWYDSKPAQERSRPHFRATRARRLVGGWTGPEHSCPEDSGIVMLIGIRLVLQGVPHLSQKLTDELVRTFRTRMLAELQTQELIPIRGGFTGFSCPWTSEGSREARGPDGECLGVLYPS